MKVKESALLALACVLDLTDNEGFGVIPDATIAGDVTTPAGVKLPAAATDHCVGVITTPADGSTDHLGVAVRGFGGTVRFKLGGTVVFGDKLTLMADGTFEANGTGTEVGLALEGGVADELIEGSLV